ncbi:hypothetical protein [Streptomyces sp. ITFR-16]|uniref:golvesin C-terminal-like domain-containing protein n=1 Tax=Streptomyces sp. ITFR-16 TaxID=3075198 RepID=UPI00288AA291|nr:hypothetical protein [Streptomyces sp. ITFR-16]WNI22745.1 hypothetical protein RLT58_12780 [Streptomyces sp. ITFR-16]
MLSTTAAGAAPGQSRPAADSPAPAASKHPGAVPEADRPALLGKGWKSSQDVAWTTSGDADGFHLLSAAGSAGYAWKNLATLAEPGFDADSWIGNACVTGTGRYAVVVYAPRTFTNKSELMARGGFTAVVNMASGAVRKLPVLTSLSYYNPGCGSGDTAVLTQSGTEERPGTRLLRLDARTGRTQDPVRVEGQVTSAVPGPGGTTLAARGAQVVSLDTSGRARTVTRTDGVPFRLTPDAHGGLLWLDRRGQDATARHLGAGALARPDAGKARPATVATGPLSRLGVTRSSTTVYVTGPSTAPPSTAPAGVGRLPDAGKDAQVSTLGTALVSHQRWADGKGTLLQPGESGTARPVDLDLTVRTSGSRTTLRAVTETVSSRHAAQGRAQSPGLHAAAPGASGKKAAVSALASSPTDPVEDERTCSVPRNDPANQAMQPKPRQVEWAVDQAVQGYLNTHISRPANWKNLGMPAYSPQSLFLNPALEGGGRAMAQVMLGVTTQESNMWQAGREAVPGVTANPLIGNFYGIDLYDGDSSNDWDIDFADADCGYGITQVTDHMRMAGREDGHGGAAWDYQKQRAAALDYTANIAAGLQILVSKWNETRAAGMIANHGTNGRPENWYFALWAYNSGFHPDQGDGSPWGLGWANNPANPEWDAGRLPFMENAAGGEDASAAAHPQNWPYQEKVLGFAAHPPSFLESPGVMVPAFRPATWNGTEESVSTKGSALYNRAHLKAPEDAFCEPTSNDCFPGRISDSAGNDNGSSGPCGREDFMCWWHKPVTWKTDCADTCGYEFLRFSTSMGEEPDGTAYPPACTVSGLPSGAEIVDDVPRGTAVHRPGCDNSGWTDSGSFSFDFGNNGSESVYPSKVDLHQLGAGFGGHFWFGHTRQDDAKGKRLKITGTWKLDHTLDKDARVWVHLPDHGAQTTKAEYQIKTKNGWSTKTVSQPGSSNRWVNLGAFRTKGITPEVKLSTVTADGTGDQDVAFDAVAFEPGNWKTVPELVIPEADENAPDPEWLDTDREKQPSPDGVISTAARSALPKEDCRSTDRPGVTQCITLDPDIDQYASRDQQRSLDRAAALDTPLVSWCDDPDVSGYTITRREGCHKLAVLINWVVDGKPFGTAVFLVRQEMLLENKGSWREKLFVSALSVDATLGPVTLEYWDSTCSPNCDTAFGTWTAPNVWEPVIDTHVTSAQRTFTWKTPTSGTSEEFDRGVFLGFGAAAPEAAGAVKTKDPSWVFWEQVRCDNGVVIKNSTGCVFAKHIPVWQTNTKRYPAAAAYYWLLREELASHPGSQARKSPMHRLTDTAAQAHNRDTVCNKTGEGKWTIHDDATGDTQGRQCDEFPFAATRESGGQWLPVTNGGVCAQLYAKQQPDKTWRLLDDDRYDPPTWTEPCGRATMPGKQNGDAGRGPGLSGFYTKARLADGDPFYMEVPGVEGCTLTDVCTIRSS